VYPKVDVAKHKHKNQIINHGQIVNHQDGFASTTKPEVKGQIKLTNNHIKLFLIKANQTINKFCKEHGISEQNLMDVWLDNMKRIMDEFEKKEECWDDVCEKFNIEVADKEPNFVTATQFFNWMKKNYNTPTKK